MGFVLSYILFGAIGFWLPDVLLNVWGINSLFLFTILPMLGLLITYLIVRHFWHYRGGPSIAFFMIVGVWLFGPTAMMVGASFSGGGFATGLADTLVVIALGLLPPYTLIMATYDGSLIGLLVASFLAIGAHLKVEMDHWILPPNMRSRLRRWYEHRAV